MKTFLKTIAMGITLVMLFSSFASCNTNHGDENTSDETTTDSEINGGTEKDTETEGKDNDNMENKDDITVKELAEKAYGEYIKDNSANTEAAKYMLYESDGMAVGLKNGSPIGVYVGRDAAIKALLGNDMLSFYGVEKTSVSGLLLCVMADVYSYPLNTLPEPTAAIDSYKDGSYVANGNRFASLIPLEGLDYERVTIKNGNQNGTPNTNFAYTFLAEAPVLGQMPVYAKGYSYVIVVEPVQALTINIPDDAEYLYVYHHTNNGKYYFPNEVIFSRRAKPENSFTLATWNTGNFSNGGKYSTITDSQLTEKQKLYTNFIENRLNADLICLNEFDPDFTTSKNHATKDVLFSEYADYVGTKYGYQCNSMFANKELNMTVPQTMNYGNGYGYLSTDITINGKTVTVVSIHLNYDHNYVKGTTDEINKKQIMDVLEAFSDKERVIFLGDWNCIQFKQYDLLADAGYTLANTDPNLWTKTGGAIDNHSLDNIAYKGVSISNFTCEITDLSDHYALTCTVSVY